MDTQESTINTQEISEAIKKDPHMEFRVSFFLSQNEYEDYYDEILNEMEANNFYGVPVNLTVLQTTNAEMYSRILKSPYREAEKWNVAFSIAQKILLQSRKYFLEEHACVKPMCAARFYNMPNFDSKKLTYKDNKKLVQVKGTVQSMTAHSYVEHAVEFICKKCKEIIVCTAEYCKHYNATPPPYCPHGSCKGLLEVREDVPSKTYRHKYQEIFLEQDSNNAMKTYYITVTCEDDLVNICDLGEDIIVVGTVEIRQFPVLPGQDCENTVVIKAISIKQKEIRVESLNPEQKFEVEDAWFSVVNEKGEFAARDLLIQSFMPEMYALNIPKLSMLLSIASCVEQEEKRPHSHTLLVGEPSVGKSQLLIRASELAPKSYFGGGYRVSKAGLTAGIRKQGKEDIYEAGILPLCDGGVCCIDEFNLISEDDKNALHEALEQQTISLAKCGIITKLRSRCVMIAACNPGNLTRLIHDDTKIIFKIQPALLSRFDTILILYDPEEDDDFQDNLIHHIMFFDEMDLSQFWSIEKLQRHLLAVRDVKPKMTVGAEKILKAYYMKLCDGACSVVNRLTARCYESLFRLSYAYCRLLMKPKVTELDAICVIRLIMENSYGFGKILLPQDPVKQGFPIGPNESDINRILHALELEEMAPLIMFQLAVAEKKVENPEELASGLTAVPVVNAEKKNCSIWDKYLCNTKSNLGHETTSPQPNPVRGIQSKNSNDDISFQIEPFTVTSTQISPKPGTSKCVDKAEKSFKIWGTETESDRLFRELIEEHTQAKPSLSVSSNSSTIRNNKVSKISETLKPFKTNIAVETHDDVLKLLDDIERDLLGNRPKKTPINDDSPSYSPIEENSPENQESVENAVPKSDSLKKLYSTFAFSQVQKRRHDTVGSGGTSDLLSPSSLQPTSSINLPKTKKSTQISPKPGTSKCVDKAEKSFKTWETEIESDRYSSTIKNNKASKISEMLKPFKTNIAVETDDDDDLNLDDIERDLLGNRPEKTPINDDSPSYSPIEENSPENHESVENAVSKSVGNSLKKLYSTFAFSQVQKRRHDTVGSGGTSDLLSPSSLQPMSSINLPKTKKNQKKSKQNVPPPMIPNDNLSDLDVNNLLNDIKLAFSDKDSGKLESQATNSGNAQSLIPDQASNTQMTDISVLGGLIDETFFDTDDEDDNV